MGNFFNEKPTGVYDKSLLQFLKQKTLDQLNECSKYMNEEYVGVNTLIFDEYKDIFGGLLEDRCQELFLIIQNNHNIDGRVDVYESFAVVAIFCYDQFEEKAKYMFRMFDFNRSLQLEKKELIMIFQTSIRALCKMILIPPPELSVLETFANDLFTSIDQNKDFSISELEFFEYLTTSEELQEFLLRYARVQTFKNSDMRTQKLAASYNKIWKEITGGNDIHECPQNIIFDKLKPMVSNNEDFELLVHMLSESSKNYKGILQDQETQDMIHEAVYNEIMLAWSAFDATDISNDGKISILEMRFIISAYEGVELDAKQVAESFKERDFDQSGEITKLEWFNYLCLLDGSGIFKGELRRYFAQADRDKNGKLEVDELKQMVKNIVGRRARKKEVLDQIVNKIYAEIDKNSDGVISWEEFKNLKMEWLNT